MDLTGTTALVTGANRGIGRALTEALAARPVKLVLAGVRDPDAFEPIERRPPDPHGPLEPRVDRRSAPRRSTSRSTS